MSPARVVVVWACAVSSIAAADPVTTIAVLPVDADVKRTIAKPLKAALESDLVESGRFALAADSVLRMALRKRKLESLSAEFDDSTQIEIGREVAADAVVTAHVTKLGPKECELSLKLFSVAKAQTRRAASAIDDCSKLGLRRAVRAAAYRLAGIAPPKTKVSIRFADTAELSQIVAPRIPEKIEKARLQKLDIDSIDIESLEAYDAALEADRSETKSPDEKIAAWKKVAKGPRKLRNVARERLTAWKRYRDAKRKSDDARRRFEARRTKHYARLARLLRLKVVSEAEKTDWAVAFVEVYGGKGSNPHFDDERVNWYLAVAAWPVLQERVRGATWKVELAELRRFFALYPKHPPALERLKALEARERYEVLGGRVRGAASSIASLIEYSTQRAYVDAEGFTLELRKKAKVDLDRCRLQYNSSVRCFGNCRFPYLIENNTFEVVLDLALVEAKFTWATGWDKYEKHCTRNSTGDADQVFFAEVDAGAGLIAGRPHRARVMRFETCGEESAKRLVGLLDVVSDWCTLWKRFSGSDRSRR